MEPDEGKLRRLYEPYGEIYDVVVKEYIVHHVRVFSFHTMIPSDCFGDKTERTAPRRVWIYHVCIRGAGT